MTDDDWIAPAPTSADELEDRVSATFLGAFVAAAKQVDLEPYRHLRQLGLPTKGHDNEALVIPFGAFMALLEKGAEASARSDFPLMVARALTLSALGSATTLARTQPTLREGLATLCAYSGQPNRRMRASLEHRGDLVAIRLSFKRRPDMPADRSPEFALGVALRAVQGLLGDDWRPRSAEFSSAAPRDIAPYERLFGHVAFDQPFDAIVFDRAELDRPLPGADPVTAHLMSQLLDQIRPRKAPFVDLVRELIIGLMPRRLCTIDEVAGRLGVDRRTVHRRLADAGVSFGHLVDEVRREGVRSGFESGGQPIATVASALGFYDQSSFTRWFRRTYGVSPGRYRKGA